MLTPTTRIERILSGEKLTPISRLETYFYNVINPTEGIKLPDPLSRKERILSGQVLEPDSRIEKFLLYLVGNRTTHPDILNRVEWFIVEAVKRRGK